MSAVVDRHDMSGVWLVQILGNNLDAEKFLKDSGVKFTRTSPTEIVFRSNYETACKCRSLARHCRMTKVQM